MTRLQLQPEATSRLAIWARRVAAFAFVASCLAVIIVRSDMLEIRPALATFGGALGMAAVALFLAFAAFVVIWREGLAGIGAALTAVAVSLVLLAYPAYFALKAYRLPWLYDITTDPIDPPRYEALARLRVREANPSTYPGLYAADQQRAAYPGVGPLGTNVTPQVAYDAALAQVAHRRCARPSNRTARGTHRSGRAHPDHGISRRRHDPGAGRARRHPYRRALLLALWRFRFRHQCRTSPRSNGRHRRHTAGAEAGAATNPASIRKKEDTDRQERPEQSR